MTELISALWVLLPWQYGYRFSSGRNEFAHVGCSKHWYRRQMTIGSLALLAKWPALGRHDTALNVVFVVCGYVATYVALDWISFFQILPGTGFTPWNPPPAASLALLVIKGLRFAPALFVAGVTSDIV